MVKADTSAPSAPASASPSRPVRGRLRHDGLLQPEPARRGSFDVTATSTDAQSGVASIGFPTVFGGDSATDTTSPYSTTYSWDDTATAVGVQTVTATNGAGLTATGTFSVTPDTTAPTGGSVSYADGYTTVDAVPLTLANGTDSGAGLASTGRRLERASATLSNGACGRSAASRRS